MSNFDPNGAATDDSGIFGLPYTFEQSSLVYLPVPWEATTSYGGGTSKGPNAILEASKQVDLFDLDVFRPYEAGLFLQRAPKTISNWNRKAKSAAQKVIKAGGRVDGNKSLKNCLKLVNELSEQVNQTVKRESQTILSKKKILAVVGGDHSTPYGALAAMAERQSFGILHIDAHSDTRQAYEGFVWSHASIMRNVMDRLEPITKLVQVGIRDFCEEEFDYIQNSNGRVETFFDGDTSKRLSNGVAWSTVCREIVHKLPSKVWISFDIDGLDPRFCPNTGTPVPGGLDYNQALQLLAEVGKSGKTILGFDLNEVAPGKDEWDANVGARLLYKLSAWTLYSQGKAKLRT